MFKKILPLVLLFIGAGAGVGAGIFLRPSPELNAMMSEKAEMASDKIEAKDTLFEYVKMSNQFVVPVVKEQKVRSLIVMSLSVEVPVGQKDAIYAKEPKLRDSFLRVLFDHASMGGFEDEFTNATNLDGLRMALREIGQRDMGEAISDVLIMEIARQDY